MGETKIEWVRGADGAPGKTWNPVRGCSVVSPGCHHCYAMRQAARFSGPGLPYEGLAVVGRAGPQWTGEVRLVPEKLAEPLSWRKPTTVFVNSMSDLFHEKLTNEEIAAVFGVMAACPQHVFQILTKRAKRMREWFAWVAAQRGQPPRSVCSQAASPLVGRSWDFAMHAFADPPWPLPWLHLGVSVESQKYAAERVPHLLQTPAAVRWVSAEPLLEAVRFDHIDADAAGHEWCQIDALAGRQTDMGRPCEDLPARLDWDVCGSESGPGARPFSEDWARSIRDQCQAAGVAFFYKQNTVNGKKIGTPELAGRTWLEFPAAPAGARA